jgi:hypothetical protein
MALRSAAEEGGDDAAYADAPVGAEEFWSEDESLAWNAEGWEEFGAAR